MPAVEEANSISAELDKQVKFEIVLIAPQIFGKDWVRSEVMISAISPIVVMIRFRFTLECKTGVRQNETLAERERVPVVQKQVYEPLVRHEGDVPEIRRR